MEHPSIAIIADDLSGALDASAPFAAAGLGVAVATGEDTLDRALAAGAEVVAVCCASRHLAPSVAAARVAAVARRLAGAHLLFKKIDSRLKGNPGAEIEAAAAASGRTGAIVAPAIPDLGRRVVAGCLVGHGMAEPLRLADRLAGAALALHIPDTPDEDALDAVAARCAAEAATMLAAGARGLASALARRFARPAAADRVRLSRPLLFAIGSRDPITRDQVERLRLACPALVSEDAPEGRLPAAHPPATALHLMTCVEGDADAPPDAVARRFAEGVAARLAAGGARTLVASGGDTAAALVAALGIGLLRPRGEVQPGLPWSEIEVPGLGPLTLVTKSGGFGGPDTLADLARHEAEPE